MAINWIEGVLERSKATGSDLLLLILLAESADRDHGTCYPGIPTLARLMRCSERYAQKCLKNLVESGEVSVKRNASHVRTNLYTLSPSLLDTHYGSPMTRYELLGVTDTNHSSPKPLDTLDIQKTRARKGLIAEDWQPDESGRSYAKELGVPRSEVQAFVEHHILKENRFTRWDLAWKGWCRNYVKFNKKSYSSNGTPMGEREFKKKTGVTT